MSAFGFGAGFGLGVAFFCGRAIVPLIGAAFSFLAGGAPDPKIDKVALPFAGVTDFVPAAGGAFGFGLLPNPNENAGFLGAGAGAGAGSAFLGAGFGAEKPKRGLGAGFGAGAGAGATFGAGLGAEPKSENDGVFLTGAAFGVSAFLTGVAAGFSPATFAGAATAGATLPFLRSSTNCKISFLVTRPSFPVPCNASSSARDIPSAVAIFLTKGE